MSHNRFLLSKIRSVIKEPGIPISLMNCKGEIIFFPSKSECWKGIPSLLIVENDGAFFPIFIDRDSLHIALYKLFIISDEF